MTPIRSVARRRPCRIRRRRRRLGNRCRRAESLDGARPTRIPKSTTTTTTGKRPCFRISRNVLPTFRGPNACRVGFFARTILSEPRAIRRSFRDRRRRRRRRSLRERRRISGRPDVYPGGCHSVRKSLERGPKEVAEYARGRPIRSRAVFAQSFWAYLPRAVRVRGYTPAVAYLRDFRFCRSTWPAEFFDYNSCYSPRRKFVTDRTCYVQATPPSVTHRRLIRPKFVEKIKKVCGR